MCVNIVLEDLTANAIIENYKINNKTFVSYSSIEKYGQAVADILSGEGEDVNLYLSKGNTDAMLVEYERFFEETKQDDNFGISLKPGKTTDDLVEEFRGNISWDTLLAFVNKKSVAKLI